MSLKERCNRRKSEWEIMEYFVNVVTYIMSSRLKDTWELLRNTTVRTVGSHVNIVKEDVSVFLLFRVETDEYTWELWDYVY